MDLRERLLNLPQELFDRIYNLTFAVDDTTPVIVHKGWKPPVQLQINRATRYHFAHEYYSSPAGFRFDYRYYQELAESWFQALPAAHCLLLKRVELRTDGLNPFGRHFTKSLEDTRHILEQFHYVFYLLDVTFFGAGVLHVDYDDKSTGKKRWLSLASSTIARLP